VAGIITGTITVLIFLNFTEMMAGKKYGAMSLEANLSTQEKK